MARRRKRNSQEGTALGSLILVVFFGALVTQVPGFLAFSVIVGLLIGALWYWLSTGERRRMRELKLADVDRMSGHDFEHYLAALLKHRGFDATVTKESGDLGVDGIAKKGNL
jgi:restriction system protein